MLKNKQTKKLIIIPKNSVMQFPADLDLASTISSAQIKMILGYLQLKAGPYYSHAFNFPLLEPYSISFVWTE